MQIGSSDQDAAGAIAADASGVYVAGRTAGNLYGDPAGDLDAFLLKLDLASGRVLWGQHLGEYGDDYATAVKLTSSKTVEISGYSRGLFSISRYGFKATYNSVSGAFLKGMHTPRCTTCCWLIVFMRCTRLRRTLQW